LHPFFFYLAKLGVFNEVAVDVVQKAVYADFYLGYQSWRPDFFHLQVLICP
jgi:hypothetical protein